MKTKEKLHYLIRKHQFNEYFIYDIQIFREYGEPRKYYSQILRFDMQSNRPDNFLKAYGFNIQDIDLYYLNLSTKILKAFRSCEYSKASRGLIGVFNKMKIKKIYPNEVFKTN